MKYADKGRCSLRQPARVAASARAEAPSATLSCYRLVFCHVPESASLRSGTSVYSGRGCTLASVAVAGGRGWRPFSACQVLVGVERPVMEASRIQTH